MNLRFRNMDSNPLELFINEEMKTATLPPNEAKSPVFPHFSYFRFFISEASSFLH